MSAIAWSLSKTKYSLLQRITLCFMFECVCVCVWHMLLAAAAGGWGDVIYSGLVLQQGHIPEHHTNLVQNSHFKQWIFVGVRELTASSYILYDYTTCGPEGTIGCMRVCVYIYIYIHTQYICAHLYTAYLYFYTVFIYLWCNKYVRDFLYILFGLFW